MRYHALATDYDGTIAHDGHVDDRTVEALERIKKSGRRLILVTGRHLDDLLHIFPRFGLFDRVVAEDGALIYNPETQQERPLGPPPPGDLVRLLRERGVNPLGVGRVIVDTREPHQDTVLEVIRELGLEHQIIFNKGAVMVLPPGLNKRAGLNEVLSELGLSHHNVVGVGDAENDHAFLQLTECAVAVANALPSVREQADYVTRGERGGGVIELADRLVEEDLAGLDHRLDRYKVLLGTAENGDEVKLSPFGTNLLVAGPSHSGKSSFVTGLLERLARHCYQFCVLDPEGDYEGLEVAVTIGNERTVPLMEEILEVLRQPQENVIVNMLGVPPGDRPSFFDRLLARLEELRAEFGRPHQVIVDEAHHFLPTEWRPAANILSPGLSGMVLVTLEPERLSPAVLQPVNRLVAIGDNPAQTIRNFCVALHRQPPQLGKLAPTEDSAYSWSPDSSAPPVRFTIAESTISHRRHIRKYAEGDMKDEAFVFRGPDGKLNLRAQNLELFNQIGAGVDDETWLYHLRRGDYSEWFRTMVKDEDLANEVERVEQQAGDSAGESRKRIREAVERRYTATV